MSYAATTWVYKNSPLRGMERFVHVAIADAANSKNGHLVTVKQSTVAHNTTASASTVASVFRKLETMGLLVRLDDPQTDRARRSIHKGIRYKLMMPSDLRTPDIETPDEAGTSPETTSGDRTSDMQTPEVGPPDSGPRDLRTADVLGTEPVTGIERKTSSTSDFQREPPEWREERMNPQKVPTMVGEWNTVLRLKSEGNKFWKQHPDLSPVGRLCASRISTTLTWGTVTDSRVAFYEAWKQETASRALTGVRESVA